MPTYLSLDFSTATPGTVVDKNGLGTGFSSVQANSTGDAYDLSLINVDTASSSLVLTATQGSNAAANNLKNALQVAVDTITQPFRISTRLKGPVTNLNAAYKQGGIFVGSDQDNYAKLVVVNDGKQLKLQFYKEQNGIGASIGKITGLNWAGIDTLDLYLTGDPQSKTLNAAYRVNSNTALPTALQQVQIGAGAASFFANSATSRAGILAFTGQSKKVDVTFDYFGVNSLGSANPDFNQINWNNVKPSPLGRTESSGIVANNKLYVFGGYIDNTYTPTKQSHAYDPGTNTWQRRADLPTAISHAGIAVAGNNIYLAGGYPGKEPQGQTFATNEVWRYNTIQNKWFAMPSLPAARGSGELSVLNGKLHFFGGVNANRIDQGTHWVLPLNGGQWTNLAPLPNPRSHMADAVVGGKLYAIGGQVGPEHEGAQAAVNVYHPATNTWKSAKSLPQALSHVSASTFVMDGKIIVAGGMLADGTDISEVKAYDPLADSWSVLSPIPGPRSSGVAGRIGNNIYFATGASPGFSATTFKGVPVKNQVVQNNAQVLYRINVGSDTPYTDSQGNIWSGDAGLFNPQGAIALNGGPVNPTPAIANTLDDTLYQSFRGKVGDNTTAMSSRVLSLDLPIATPQSVNIKLHFAELYYGAPGRAAGGAGKRVFDVIAEGQTILNDFDIFAASGDALKAVVVPINGIQVNDGTLNLQFKAEQDFASISAIEVLAAT